MRAPERSDRVRQSACVRRSCKCAPKLKRCTKQNACCDATSLALFHDPVVLGVVSEASARVTLKAHLWSNAYGASCGSDSCSCV